jgi:hypothetical protein
MALAAVITIFVALRRHDAPFAPASVPAIIAPPPDVSGKAARDWNRLVEELQRGHYEGARHKLDDYERKWGATAKTEALREQLDTLPRDVGDHERHKPDDE